MAPSICIVGGCGHVGLPLGIALADAGAAVAVYDTSAERVAAVAGGLMPFDERGADAMLARVLAAGRFCATTAAAVITEADVVIVTIGTPVDEFLDPGVRSFDRAMDAVLSKMRSGQLLILRSTVFPGVTDRLGRQLHERGLQIDLAHCPERIAQGFALEELSKLPQIIGGTTARANQRACEVFRLLGARLLELPSVEAELAKLFANAHRYINFAISNQFYIMAQQFGADFSRLHQAVTCDYPRLAGFAKAGFAGGPCLLKDTMQLAAFNHNLFPIGTAAMKVNEGLPSVLVHELKRKRDLTKDTVAILGMAFKGNCDDPRDSLSYKLRKVLALECRVVLCTDPFIEDPDFVSLDEALRRADVVFLGACHDAYRNLRLRQPVVDVFNFLPRNAEVRAIGLAA